VVGLDAFIAFPPPADEAVRIVKILALVFQGIAWTDVLVTFWLAHWASNNPQQSDRTTMAALGFGVRLVLWSLLVLLALQNYGVNITTLITGLGVGGIAIALAVQNILGDLFAALSIVLDKPFVIGDYVVVDQHEGTVEQVGLKTTRIRSVNGEQIVVSNADLLRSRIRNYARLEGRRFLLRTTVSSRSTRRNCRRFPTCSVRRPKDSRTPSSSDHISWARRRSATSSKPRSM